MNSYMITELKFQIEIKWNIPIKLKCETIYAIYVKDLTFLGW